MKSPVKKLYDVTIGLISKNKELFPAAMTRPHYANAKMKRDLVKAAINKRIDYSHYTDEDIAKLRNKAYPHTYEIGGYTVNSLDELSEGEKEKLGDILAYFPDASPGSKWPAKFESFNPERFDNKLLKIAANARDHYGNTMLGVAAEHGERVGKEAARKLLTMGADINGIDGKNKLALHWAISNKKSYLDKGSFEKVEIVGFLLEQGARTDIKCYQNKYPIQYAQKRGYTAAEDLITRAIQRDPARSYDMFAQSFIDDDERCVRTLSDDNSSEPECVKLDILRKFTERMHPSYTGVSR